MADSPTSQPPDDPERRRATLKEARALAHPLRVRIVRLCLDRACTNAELAAALGEQPATVLHHVRTLVANGFLSETGWRRGPRGSTEKPYRATGKSWQLQGALDAGNGAILQSVFQAVAAEIDEAGPGSLIEGARMAFRLTPDQLDMLVGRLRELLETLPPPEQSLGDEPPTGDPYALLLLLHRRREPPGGAHIPPI